MTGSLQFNRLILDLYRAARQLPPRRFKQWSLSQCRPWLTFDQAYWACAHILPGNIPQWFEIECVSCELQAPSASVSSWISEGIGVEATQQLEPGEDDQTGWVLASTRSDTRAALVHCIALHRQHPFEPQELAIKQQLVAHLHEASLINSFWNLRGGYQHEQVCYALCDEQGLLQEVEHEFIDLLGQEFGNWAGPWLPFQVQAGSCYLGERFRVRGCPREGGLLLKVEPLPILALLTPKQREVAALLVEGWSYKAIARRLSISPSTVTNHSNAIYQRLGVSSKAELIRLWDQAREAGFRTPASA